MKWWRLSIVGQKLSPRRAQGKIHNTNIGYWKKKQLRRRHIDQKHKKNVVDGRIHQFNDYFMIIGLMMSISTIIDFVSPTRTGLFWTWEDWGGQFDPRLSFSTKKVIWSPFLVYNFLTPKWVCKTKIVNIRRRRRRHCRGEYHDVIALVKPRAAIKWP